ncbi:M20/M25/M40 family metallo-hydrolase [Litoribacter alkaliphilus]|uniref:M20/M25/M40 family metallo-hydrolase n=1 Tax=Litoribacter ruber TaxID=702568 RepID=A0AAP2CFS7_9BACT|nr:M20/M25/M40 family metallo-hydrolase [Litoribacter alkaliphilus]MBS9523798.1 M20/M25/M40 family metallo-hydrolase [Litoribacter alkaliphilus]
MTSHFYKSLLILFLSISSSLAQTVNLDQMTEESLLEGIHLLNHLVSIPNNSHHPDQLHQNLDWCKENFEKRGWEVEELDTEGFPLLLTSFEVEGAEKTVLMYFHVDGQAVDPAKWKQENPYKPVLKEQNSEGDWEEISFDRLKDEFDPEWRIYGRSTSDDKGPLAMFLTAWDALNDREINPDYNIKIILDFEEEIGSPNLPEAVNKHSDRLQADMMLIMDGPRHLSNEPTLSFGARGIARVTLTTFGPKNPQHSGHYGNYAPNPALHMSKLLGSMKDEQGRVIIMGFYDGITLSPEEMEILEQVPDDEEAIKTQLEIAAPDQVGSTYQEALQYPSLNIRGLSSGWVGNEARTIVPSEAVAEMDIRLVPESDPEKLFALLKSHIQNQGFFITEENPTTDQRLEHPKIVKWEGEISYQAFRTPFDSEPGTWLRKAYQRAFAKEPLMIRMGGGSIPISPFIEALDIPAVIVPTVNPDNNQHSPNENIRLGNYKEGIKTMLSILTEPLTAEEKTQNEQ